MHYFCILYDSNMCIFERKIGTTWENTFLGRSLSNAVVICKETHLLSACSTENVFEVQHNRRRDTIENIQRTCHLAQRQNWVSGWYGSLYSMSWLQIRPHKGEAWVGSDLQPTSAVQTAMPTTNSVLLLSHDITVFFIDIHLNICWSALPSLAVTSRHLPFLCHCFDCDVTEWQQERYIA